MESALLKNYGIKKYYQGLTIMTELISETRPIARKNHDCMASDWIQDIDLTGELSFSERRALVMARRESW